VLDQLSLLVDKALVLVSSPAGNPALGVVSGRQRGTQVGLPVWVPVLEWEGGLAPLAVERCQVSGGSG
jgi:hypothetical protein